MLEAGCGTGNYSLAFLQHGIGKLTMFDASTGMITHAKEKVEEYKEKVVEIKEHKLPTIPYPDDSFDVVTLIQVLHHLDTHHLNVDVNSLSGDEEIQKDDPNNVKFPNLVKSIREAYRVLKPNGVLLIDTSFEQNINASYISLAPKALELWKKAFIHEREILDILREEKFQNIFCVNRPGTTLSRTSAFQDPELILDSGFRGNLSEWSFVDRTGELDGIIELINRKKEEGKLEEFRQVQNRLYMQVGEQTTIFARKL